MSVEVELPAVQDQQVAGRVLLVQGLPRLDFRTFGGIGRQQSFVWEINKSEELVINIGRWSLVKRTAKIDLRSEGGQLSLQLVKWGGSVGESS